MFVFRFLYVSDNLNTFACGRALMQEYRRRKEAREFEEEWPRSGPGVLQHMLLGYVRWQEEGISPAWFNRQPPVPVDVLQREQDADFERMLAALDRQPEGALLLCLWFAQLCIESSAPALTHFIVPLPLFLVHCLADHICIF